MHYQRRCEFVGILSLFWKWWFGTWYFFLSHRWLFLAIYFEFQQEFTQKVNSTKNPHLKISITTISNKIQQTFPPNSTHIPLPKKHPWHFSRPGVFVYRGKVQMPASGEVGQQLKMARGMKQWNWLSQWLTFGKLTYPTWGSWENHRLKYAENQGDMLINWRVTLSNFCGIKMRLVRWVIKPNLSYPPGNDHISYHILFPVDTFESMMFLFLRWDTSVPERVTFIYDPNWLNE